MYIGQSNLNSEQCGWRPCFFFCKSSDAVEWSCFFLIHSIK